MIGSFKVSLLVHGLGHKPATQGGAIGSWPGDRDGISGSPGQGGGQLDQAAEALERERRHRFHLPHPHLPHGLVTFPRRLLPWIEPWFLAYACLGIVQGGMLPLLLPLSAGGSTHAGMIVGVMNLAGLTAPFWGHLADRQAAASADPAGGHVGRACGACADAGTAEPAAEGCVCCDPWSRSGRREHGGQHVHRRGAAARGMGCPNWRASGVQWAWPGRRPAACRAHRRSLRACLRSRGRIGRRGRPDGLADACGAFRSRFRARLPRRIHRSAARGGQARRSGCSISCHGRGLRRCCATSKCRSHG